MTRSLFFMIAFIGCTSNKNVVSTVHQEGLGDESVFKVYKIDSVNSYYLIYAQKQDSLFKIVSKKDSCLNTKLIEIGEKYAFLLKSIWNTPIQIKGANASPSSVYNVSCVNLDDSTKICLERDSINDVHTASNICGLCFVE